MECFFTIVQEGAEGKQSQSYDLKKVVLKTKNTTFIFQYQELQRYDY